MKRYIKIINNERIKVKIISQKACDISSIDVCTSLDYGNCTINSYDYCGKDYSTCTQYSDDICPKVDLASYYDHVAA